jgi:hypothetical protein
MNTDDGMAGRDFAKPAGAAATLTAGGALIDRTAKAAAPALQALTAREAVGAIARGELAAAEWMSDLSPLLAHSRRLLTIER